MLKIIENLIIKIEKHGTGSRWLQTVGRPFVAKFKSFKKFNFAESVRSSQQPRLAMRLEVAVHLSSALLGEHNVKCGYEIRQKQYSN